MARDEIYYLKSIDNTLKDIKKVLEKQNKSQFNTIFDLINSLPDRYNDGASSICLDGTTIANVKVGQQND